MVKLLKDVDMRKIQELMEIDKQMHGFTGQRNKHEMAIDNIRELIKELKSNRTMKLQQVVGGNLIKQIPNQSAIKLLQERKAELEKGLKAIDEQMMHRQDGYTSALIKVYRMLEDHVPPDVKE